MVNYFVHINFNKNFAWSVKKHFGILTYLEYRLLRKKGEGSFSEVIEAIHIISKKRVAIKCMKKTFESLELVNKLREIQTLKKISPHDNIVELREIL